MVGVVRRSGGCGHGGCSEEVMVGVVRRSWWVY